MNEMNEIQDGEIDLFDLCLTLWGGKWLIGAFVVLAIFIGYGYSQVVQPKYDVSVPYTINVYSVSSQQICKSASNCKEAQTKKLLLSLLGVGWSSNLSLSTTTPLDESEYEAQLERANVALTNELYIEATTEVALIETELADALLNTERVATNMLNAKRLIQTIDRGQTAITFSSVSVVKTSPKVPQILVLSLVLGWIIGVGFILVRNAIRKLKERLAKA